MTREEAAQRFADKADDHYYVPRLREMYLMAAEALREPDVKIVHCKDCKKVVAWENAFGVEGFKCTLFCVDISPEAYCSYGESKLEG